MNKAGGRRRIHQLPASNNEATPNKTAYATRGCKPASPVCQNTPSNQASVHAKHSNIPCHLFICSHLYQWLRDCLERIKWLQDTLIGDEKLGIDGWLHNLLMNMHTGSCLCGGIQFRIQGDLPPIQICYCGQCRKAQGAAFASNVPIQAANFELLKGQDLMKAYEATPGKRRWFCQCCGSPIYSERDSLPGVLRVRIGTVDEPIQARPAFHAFVDSKCSWWDVPDDGLPRHPQWPAP